MKVVIIEDEKLLQKELIEQLKLYPDIQVIQCLQSVHSSVEWLQVHYLEVDLIFMDIELADGVCFEIFERIDISVPIIFLTAYSEYALKAFKVNSVDYLLKPIQPEELKFAIDKYQQQSKAFVQISSKTFNGFFAKEGSIKKNRFLITSGEHYKYVITQEIAYFISDQKYTTLVTFKDEKYLIDDSLNQLELNLDQDVFYRPSRNLIVNIKAIVKASKYFNSRLKLFIEPAPLTDIIISRANVKDFLGWMGANRL